jgi:hypothetical protein
MRFAIIGDYGNNGPDEAAVAVMIKSWQPDFIVTVGDNNYPNGEAITLDTNVGLYFHEYIGEYKGRYGAGSAENRFFPALGNHDWYSVGGQPAVPEAYLNYFTLPGAGVASSNTSGNERYYDFSWGAVQFFMLDSWDEDNCPCEPDGFRLGARQYNWARQQMERSTALWKIVVLHHSPYSSALPHGSTEIMQWPFQSWGATAVVGGHAHVYERVMRDDNGDGIETPYFVNGAGGASLYEFPTSGFVDGSQVRYNAAYGAMLVEACRQGISFTYYSVTEGPVDSYTMGEPAACPQTSP